MFSSEQIQKVVITIISVPVITSVSHMDINMQILELELSSLGTDFYSLDWIFITSNFSNVLKVLRIYFKTNRRSIQPMCPIIQLNLTNKFISITKNLRKIGETINLINLDFIFVRKVRKINNSLHPMSATNFDWKIVVGCHTAL